MFYRTILIYFVLIKSAYGSLSSRPHIIFILADDLGWNDVGFHGENQIPTPNIDALAYSGLPLQNYYVTPICTPSRSALMTGKYPIHTGMQHGVIYGAEPRGLPLSEKILPQYLKDLGYKTHLVGKWHLGSYKNEYLPFNRGFDTFTGYLTGKIDMYDHTNMEKNMWGFDFKQNSDILTSYDLFGKYATDVFTNEAMKIIKSHNQSEPMFLLMAHAAVHSGNPYEPLRAPENVISQFSNIPHMQRRKFAGVLSKLDESVGKVVSALQTAGLLQNSIVVFSTDNGGPAAGFNDNQASNYPLRGVKNTLWEGGVRGAGLLWSPLLAKRSRVSTQAMHISDWLPTLFNAAGGNVRFAGVGWMRVAENRELWRVIGEAYVQQWTAIGVFENIDGIDLWKALSEDLASSRQSILHNIDDEFGSAAITVGKWKLVKGTNYHGNWDGWYGPDARKGYGYNVSRVYDALAGRALHQLGLMPNRELIEKIRDLSTVRCGDVQPIECKPLETPCLFNIHEDPCERRNLAYEELETLGKLLDKLSEVNMTAVPPNNKPLDPRGNPKFWNRIFLNFGDYVTSEH